MYQNILVPPCNLPSLETIEHFSKHFSLMQVLHNIRTLRIECFRVQWHAEVLMPLQHTWANAVSNATIGSKWPY